MMTRNLFLILLLISAQGLHAQRPQLQLHADFGASRTYISYEDPYASLYQKNHLAAGLAASLKLRLGYAVAFEPEVGLGLGGMQFYYRNARIRDDVDSRLLLGFVSAAPMLAFYLNPRFALLAGVSVAASTFTLGNLVVWTFENGPEAHSFKGHFGDIRNPVVWGPRLLLKYEFKNKVGRAMGFRLGSFLDMNPIFQQQLATPFNPRFVQVFAGVSYSPFKSAKQ